jgi:dihydroorotate dehydrogenase (fumarate)
MHVRKAMTVDLSTSYLGLKLPHPLILGASPLVDDLDMVRRAEDGGAAAIVMRSLFDEDEPSADRYLEQIRLVKRAVAVPVMGSLNGPASRGWLHQAARVQEAGADAIELNLYQLGADPAETSATLEARMLDVVREVRASVTLPLAVKLSPFFTSLAHFAVRLEQAGADGLVLFNRVHQPDFDPERLASVREITLSTPADLPLRLVWLAALSGRGRASLAVSGGVHLARHAIKAVMAGAHAVQLVSAVLQRGPEHIGVVRDGMQRWLEEHGYESVAQVQGSMSSFCRADAAMHERAGYVDVLRSWHPPLRQGPASRPPAP